MLNGMGLGIVLSARDMASATLGRVERAYMSLDRRVEEVMDDIGRSMNGFGGRALAMTAGVAGAFGIAAITNAAGDFQEQLTAVGAISGATSEQLRLLEKAALQAGMTTQYAPLEGTAALREYAQAGFQAEDQIKLLVPALDLAAASFGELTPAGAAGLATQTMKAFGIAAEGASLMVDQLLMSANLFAIRSDELPLAMGIAARGAGAMKQSLTETLVAVGLVKNIIPGTERAATAVSVAMEKMAEKETADKLAKIGVKVADSKGNFRDFLDVINDLSPKLAKMSEEKQADFIIKTFGREALGGVQNIMTQLTNGVKNQAGEMLKGADAVAYLRQQFEEAGGTAAAIREKMLGTFKGQAKLLGGVLKTMATVIGMPLIETLTPVLKVLVGLLKGLVEAIENAPAPLKRVVAGILVAGVAVAALVIGLNALRAGFVMVALGIRLVKAATMSALATMGPMILIIGAIAAVIAAFVIAYRKNLGGFADFVHNVGAKVQLAFDAIVQVFHDGAFSGSVMDELGKAENSGLKRFVVTLYMIWHRLQRLWVGITEGFTAAMDVLRPVWEELVSAFRDVGSEASGLAADITGAASSLPSQQFVSFGQKVGKVLGWIASAAVAVVGWHARLVGGFLAGFRAVQEYLAPAFGALKEAFGALIGAFKELFGVQEDSTIAAGEVGSVFRTVGEVLGTVFGAAVTAVTYILTGLVWVVKLLFNALAGLRDRFIEAGTWMIDIGTKLYTFFAATFGPVIRVVLENVGGHFKAMKDFVVMMIDEVRAALESLIDWMRAALESVTGFFSDVGDGISSVTGSVGDFVGGAVTSVGDAIGVGGGSPAARAAGLVPEGSAAAAEAGTRGGMITGLREQVAAAVAAAQSKMQPAAVNVALQVDGETLARVSARASEDAARRAFVPSF